MWQPLHTHSGPHIPIAFHKNIYLIFNIYFELVLYLTLLHVYATCVLVRQSQFFDSGKKLKKDFLVFINSFAQDSQTKSNESLRPNSSLKYVFMPYQKDFLLPLFDSISPSSSGQDTQFPGFCLASSKVNDTGTAASRRFNSLVHLHSPAKDLDKFNFTDQNILEI